jgi:hypothetical protein
MARRSYLKTPEVILTHFSINNKAFPRFLKDAGNLVDESLFSGKGAGMIQFSEVWDAHELLFSVKTNYQGKEGIYV